MTIMFKDTLKDAQVAWKHTIENDGGRCPCCGKWGKIYAYGISKVNAKALLWLCLQQKETDKYIDVRNNVPDYVLRSTLSTLHWWGLIQQAPQNYDASYLGNKRNKNKKHEGLWRATALGEQFAYGLIQLPKQVFIYDNTLQGVSTKTVYIRDCLDKNFNYEEMMKTIFAEEVAL